MKTSNDTDIKKIIKKSDKLTLKEMREIQDAEDQLLLEANTVNYTAPVVEEQPVITIEPRVPDYIALVDNPPVQSVGNSGWQVSDVWRDIRVDDFCG
ncbi:hypothetical protein GTQ43_31475 [Nostoc sp. KVJ3]|uniref:hypothetical protein n=1 Tax=Nostoc sp. KVJ3 TaxID=457945 RepID=UPI002236FA96|nr:hypothetical protein [Nostoc sp. KVJ3]MCW5318112.1 hypothetical protein [Nostoc sp. KVJ3]